MDAIDSIPPLPAGPPPVTRPGQIKRTTRDGGDARRDGREPGRRPDPPEQDDPGTAGDDRPHVDITV